ncbi:unnamed protein product [Fraxinus pennsylvanica]|uniref:Uncharacterized protein n=1 Tax=Fraxinus pennsylvanica TaxID=56036 RepID=A0AAD2A877_9LAMI|nr:unnamed protein product [Fraxinus pennsylvanica]
MSLLAINVAESPVKSEGLQDELRAFDATKTGVKGLVDAGIENIPKIFIRPADEVAEESNYGHSNLQVPVIDLNGIEADDQRRKIISEVKNASKEWGFFQVVNHGIPQTVLDSMLDGVSRFHEQDAEEKKKFYSREPMKKVKYYGNIDPFRKRAVWRDTFTISLMTSCDIEPDELPVVCRNSTFEYINEVTKLGKTLYELLSEALGLKREYLEAMEFLRDNQWIDVPPRPGSFVINIGDNLQMVSNDEFKSAWHRVLSNQVGPRISVACFLAGVMDPTKVYGPIKELISEENPPIYKDFTVNEHLAKFYSKPIGKSCLDDFKFKN